MHSCSANVYNHFINTPLHCEVLNNKNQIDAFKYGEELIDCSKMSVKSLSGGVFRPRGALARTLYDKHQNDCKLRDVNKQEISSANREIDLLKPRRYYSNISFIHRSSPIALQSRSIASQSFDSFDDKWYKCDLAAVSEDVRTRFHQLTPDNDTRKFIADSIDKSSWLWTQMWYSLMQSVLGFFMTKTDINGWLGRGSMFVMSLKQFSELIEIANERRGNPHSFEDIIYHQNMGALVDLGAGDGEVTLRWSPLFTHLYATEISSSMRKLLQTKGFEILDTDNWWTYRKFSAISMLNLLDRCSQPRTMMLSARQAMEDDGFLIIALVLPFCAYVEYSTDHSPSEKLPIIGETFEQQAASFIEYAKEEIGLDVVVWSRVPYLCEGDLTQSYYWLDDAIFIFRKI